MKKLILCVVVAACAVMVACRKTTPEAAAAYAAEDREVYYALMATDMLDGMSSERSVAGSYVIDGPSSVFDGAQQSVPQFRLINFSDDMGYALVSLNEGADNPVLMFSDTGNIDEKMMDGERFRFLIALASRGAAVAGANKPSGNLSLKGWVGVKDIVRPLVKVKWGQKAPFNNHSPVIAGRRAVAGCVPVALAQIVASHAFPKQIADRKGVAYDLEWDKIAGIRTYMDYETNVSHAATIAGEQIAVLIDRMGTLSGVEYGTSESGAYHEEMIKALREVGYHTSDFVAQFSVGEIIGDMRAGNPVVMADVVSYDNRSLAHAFIADGYLAISTDGGRDSATEEYVACNWGWDGVADGYVHANLLRGAGMLDEIYPA